MRMIVKAKQIYKAMNKNERREAIVWFIFITGIPMK